MASSEMGKRLSTVKSRWFIMKIKVNDNQYFVKVHGKGEPVVLLHGFTGSTNTWQEMMDPLLDEYQCITIDLPGHGQTDANVDNMEQCCWELNELLNQLSICSFHLLGYSMGGRTALVFTSMFPEKVKTLILESASPGLEEEAKNERAERDNQLAKFMVEKGIEEFVNYWETIPLFKSQERLPVSARRKIREERLNQRPSGLAMSLRSMGTGVQPTLWSSLNDIQVPTVLITGELDDKFVEINQKMVEAFPHAVHETIPNVGHAPHLENPNSFGKIVMKYL